MGGDKRNFRLSKDAFPSRYRLVFELDFDSWTSTGNEGIEIRTARPTREIVLHAIDLDIKSASIDKTALAVQIGARFKATNHWTFGLDGEWNPWITLNGYRFGSGVFNLYGTAILRFPLTYENFNLRATVNLGASYLLMSLYGAPSGSLGVYAGVSPAGLEWKLSRTFILVVNPLNIALPVPQLRGVPLTYPQYRFSIGFEIQKG